MSTILDYMTFDESPKDNQQTVECGGFSFNFAKFTIEEARIATEEVDNVINVVLGLVGLSIDSPPTGDLDGLDIHNFSAVDALRIALLEGIRDNILYDIQIKEDGTPEIYTIDTDVAGDIDVWMIVTTDVDKIPYAVVVRGNDPLPYMELRDPIHLINQGEGPEVEVVSLGEFNYEECGGQLYNYYGAISYKDPNFDITSESEIEHAITLKSYESLVGVIYTFVKPDDVDVNFDSTTPVEARAILFAPETMDINEFNELMRSYNLPNVGVKFDEETIWAGSFNSGLGCESPCLRIEPDYLMPIFSSDYTILGVQEAIMRGSRFIGFNYNVTDSTNICETSYSDFGSMTTYSCADVNTDSGFFKLSLGSDIFYTVESNKGGKSAYSAEYEEEFEYYDYYSEKYFDNVELTLDGANVLRVAMPYKITDAVLRITGDPGTGIEGEWHNLFVDLPNSISTVVLPAEIQMLVTIDKPSIHVTKKTLDPVGNVLGDETEDYRQTLDEIVSQISLCATPIISVNLPPPTAYNAGEGSIILDQEGCVLDKDPTTVQDTINTPCEKMNQDTNGKAILDMTLPFLAEDEVVPACDFLYGKASYDYAEGSAVVDGMTVSSDDLGKQFNGGVINRISWSYQDSSSFRANISYGSPITGLSSGNLSLYVQATDSALTREGTVTSDMGNGYEYMVSIKDLGTYKAVTMVLADIRVGDTVNVTIYNNIAEARF